MDATACPSGDWRWPTATRFGPGRCAELAAACVELEMRRPLIVRDPGLEGLAPLETALAGLAETGSFSDVRGNPSDTTVAGGVAAFVGGEHDGVVAIGGGSALDTGKAVALLAYQTDSPWDFLYGQPLPTDAAPVAPVIAVPTTAGTGSEYSASAVILDAAAGAKRSLWHPHLLPGRVILDPVLTLGLPQDLTLWTGLDALVHNIEAYLSPAIHPMADAVALAALTRIATALPQVLAAPNDRAARGEMLLASAMGAAAFDKGLGAVHALSHAVSARFDTHHGLTNAVLLPYVLDFVAPAVPGRLAAVATVLTPDGNGGDSDDPVAAIRGFLARFDLPASLAELGVADAHWPTLADLALADANAATSPRRLCRQSAIELLKRASNGV